MFRALIPPNFRSTRLCVTACGIMHPRCCWPATSWVHYTTSCNTQSSAPEYERDQRPKSDELIGIKSKSLLLHLIGFYHVYHLLSYFILSSSFLFQLPFLLISLSFLPVFLFPLSPPIRSFPLSASFFNKFLAPFASTNCCHPCRYSLPTCQLPLCHDDSSVASSKRGKQTHTS